MSLRVLIPIIHYVYMQLLVLDQAHLPSVALHLESLLEF